MAQYKVTRVYTIAAASKADALKALTASGYDTEYLDTVYIREVEQEKPKGFVQIAKEQVFGTAPQQSNSGKSG